MWKFFTFRGGSKALKNTSVNTLKSVFLMGVVVISKNAYQNETDRFTVNFTFRRRTSYKKDVKQLTFKATTCKVIYNTVALI